MRICICDNESVRLSKIRQRFFAKTKLADSIRPGMTTPCLEWQAALDHHGYGRLSSRLGRVGSWESAHRVAWELAHGPIPEGLKVLHKCDNPPCVTDEHLFLGTMKDNTRDMMAKGRQSAPPHFCGEEHWSRRRPDRIVRGDAHWSHLHPERMARGEHSGSRLHPESRPRGEGHSRSKLTDEKVRSVFQLRAQGWTVLRLAADFGVCVRNIYDILARKTWKHVELEVQS